MTAPTWQPGTLYPTGAIVQRASAPPVVSSLIPNPNFEDGDVDWTKSGGAVIQNTGGFSGPWCAFITGASGRVLMQAGVPVVPGQSVTASVMGRLPVGSPGTSFDCVLNWYDAGDVFISTTEGVELTRAQGSGWRQSTTTGIAPAGAAFVRVGADGNVAVGGEIYLDNFTWNYTAPAAAAGLVFKAVQPTIGTSDNVEPTWPTVLGVQVNDGTVIWEAVAATRVVWEATPLFRTGATEPNWPLVPGETVADGTLLWEAVSRRVEDPNCPNNKATIILASHVFNEDGDIVRFCAVNNALDWTSESNAGFLPSGMQGQNANDARVLADYRKNLAVLNASSFQLWQADPDPEIMDLLDMKNGFGSIYPRAACSVGDDLFVLTAEGVRNITQAAGNNSNTAGAVGAPIDDLVQAQMAAVASPDKVISVYYPGLGQYLLAFAYDEQENFVPLDEAVAFNFVSSNATIEGNVVSYDGASSGDFQIGLPDGEYPIRIISDSWEITGPDPVAGTFEWSLAAGDTDTQTNTAPDLATAFEPSPLDIDVVVDGMSENPGIEFAYGSENATTYQFSLYLEQDPTPARTEVFVATKMAGGKWSWSRYVFPFAITDFSQYENDLYFRHGDHISVFDKTLSHDEMDATGTIPPVEFAGRVQWNWLDMGAPGTTKHLQAFDIIGTGTPSVSFGYNERQKDTAFTDPYTVDADTLPDGPIQYEVTAPSISVKIDFAAGTPWSLSSFIAYVDDLGATV